LSNSEQRDSWFNSGHQTLDTDISALIFNIKGYFDFVNYNRLIAEMQKWQILLAYLRWTKSFLSQRKAAIYMNRAREEMSNIENRIP